MLGRFSRAWEEDLRQYLADEDRYARLNALVGIRNDIAHGKNQGVSTSQALSYYELANDIVRWFSDRLEPTT